MNDAAESAVTGWLGGQSERTIETACARVFLMGETALKVKRHIHYSYVDFTTLEQRRWALERELAFNSAAAPDIYRAVRRITRAANGALALDGDGETIDFALEMRRFDDRAVLSANPAAMDGELGEALGREIAGYHAKAELRPDTGWRGLEFTIGSNASLLRELSSDLGRDRVEHLIGLTAKVFAEQTPLLKARVREGFDRHCHGDLHLGNILIEAGRPILFDCIEFNDLLSDLDVFYDLAFLLMDLEFRGRRDVAVRVLSAYLDSAARDFPPTLWEGLAAMPLMLSVRAGVRTHVAAHSGSPDLARAYLAAAIDHLSPPPPLLSAVGGFSGSGKTVFARQVASHLGASPGAVILRTDEIRKRLAKAGPTEALDPATYTPAFYSQVYDTMLETARTLLNAGRAVVLDATFIDPALRSRAEAIARDCRVPFHGAWLEAPLAVLEARVAARTGDASDATIQVLRDQVARGAGPIDWLKVNAAAPPELAAADWIARIGR